MSIDLCSATFGVRKKILSDEEERGGRGQADRHREIKQNGREERGRQVSRQTYRDERKWERGQTGRHADRQTER